MAIRNLLLPPAEVLSDVLSDGGGGGAPEVASGVEDEVGEEVGLDPPLLERDEGVGVDEPSSDVGVDEEVDVGLEVGLDPEEVDEGVDDVVKSEPAEDQSSVAPAQASGQD